MNKWYIDSGNNSDVVISSKISLRRNIVDTPFPIRMNSEIRKNTNKKIFASLKNSKFAGELNLINLGAFSYEKALSFREKGLISKDFLNNREEAYFILSNDESTSIMLCEEDHINLQVMRAGQNLESAYKTADEIDDELTAHLKIAFSNELGYLTSSPTVLGTGMTASVILHLPALAIKGEINRLGAMVNKLGLSLKFALGDNRTSNASFYQLSNQITLGISEKSAIDNLNAICEQIIKREREAREELKNIDDFEDKTFRAMGTLKMARKLNSDEFLGLISIVRLGTAMGYFDVPYETISELIIKMQNGNLSTDAQAELSSDVADKLRAKLVREALD